MEYLSVSDILKAAYGQKVYRLSLQSGCTCPNRDGTIGYGGCTFCSKGGSGDFAAPNLPIDQQIFLARQRVDSKIPAKIPLNQRKYIAYFQSYTNTYGDTEGLFRLYEETIRRPEICILSVGTRPDCLEDEKIYMLQRLDRIKPVWVELGLQTSNDITSKHIRRGYPLSVFDDAYRRLKEAGLTVIVHVILGLPGESREDMLNTVRHVSSLFLDHSLPKSEAGVLSLPDTRQKGLRLVRADGIKLQLLHVLRGTDLADEYKRTHFHILTPEEYCDIITSCLQILPKDTVVHRLTGDGPKDLLIAPLWSADKKRVLNMLNQAIRRA